MEYVTATHLVCFIAVNSISISLPKSAKMKSLIRAVFCIIIVDAILDEAHVLGNYQFLLKFKDVLKRASISFQVVH